MPSTIDAQIRTRIAEFAEELTALVKQAAMESVQDALGGSAAPAKRRGPGRPRAAKSERRKPGRRPGRPRKARAAKATARAGKRVRRTAGDIEALAGKVHAYVRSNAGARMEEIRAALGVQTKDLGRPVASLLEAKKLRTEGQRRGTRYFAGGGKGRGRKAGKAKDAGRKKAGKRKAAKKAKPMGRKKATVGAAPATSTAA